jgi:hypothetical protein
LIATELVQQKQFEAAVLVTISIGGTSIARWAPGGNLHAHLMSAVEAVGPAFWYTHVFIQQGEADLLGHTTAEDYFHRFAKVIAALRQNRVDAPIFVARNRLLRWQVNAAEAEQSDRRGPQACDCRPRRVVLRCRHGCGAQLNVQRR